MSKCCCNPASETFDLSRIYTFNAIIQEQLWRFSVLYSFLIPHSKTSLWSEYISDIYPLSRALLTSLFFGSFNDEHQTWGREMGQHNSPLTGKAMHSSPAGLCSSSAPPLCAHQSWPPALWPWTPQSHGWLDPYSFESGSVASGKAAVATRDDGS